MGGFRARALPDGAPAVNPTTHSYYIVRSSPTDSLPHVVTINTQTGTLVESPPLAQGIFALGFDSASSKLVGITVCCPNEFVQVDPATGALTILSSVGDAGFGFSPLPAVDPATHSYYIPRSSPTDSQLRVVTINTQTGSLVESPPLAQGVFALGFDPSVAPTPTPPPTPTQTPRPPAVAVPTLSTRALAALALAIAGVSLFVIRRS